MAKEDSMTLPEGRAIFEILEAMGGVATVDKINNHLELNHLRKFNDKSIRRTTLFYRLVWQRVEVGQSIEPKKKITSELAQLIKYDTTESWVALRLMWYSQWRRERDKQDKVDRARIERLLGHMWVPRFEDLVPFMLRGDGNLHAAELAGRTFRWLETDKKSGQKWRKARCWLSDDEDRWFRSMLGMVTSEIDRARILTAYDVLQRDVSEYFHAAARQKTAEEIGGELTVDEVLSNFRGGSTATSHSRFEELLGLALDPQDLRDSVITFVDEVRFVVGL